MAEKKIEPLIKTAEYKLPTGAVIHARKANNRDRRTLLESPDLNRQNLMEMLASGCIVKIEFPKGHEMYPSGHSVEFSMADTKDVWMRLDELALEDSISYVEAFGANNWPGESVIKQVIEASKEKK